MSATDEILFERQGGVGIVTLNRPRALNTLSLGMYRAFAPQLDAWRDDPAIRAVVVRGAGERAFCAGGDVRAIYDTRGALDQPDFFREEYGMIRRIHRFPKPYIALMDGITMGGGAGVAINGSHRIATERTLLAMPEVLLGLFPDVGATRFLARCPGRMGLYLALTGARIAAADALYGGLATHIVPSARLAELVSALVEAEPMPARLAAILGDFAEAPAPAPLAALQSVIDRTFAGDTVATIVAALKREPNPWAGEALAAIDRASPTSLAITLRQMRSGAAGSIEAALRLEYRLSQHCMGENDFYEGIRALLVDKDNRPRWCPKTFAEVSETAVESHFSSLGERELSFDATHD